MGIRENKEAADEAESLFDSWIVGSAPKEGTQRFWERLIELAQDKLPAKKEPRQEVTIGKLKPMNDIAAKGFEKTKIPFGEYKDAYVGQVDYDYLDWLAQENDFVSDVRRYVASQRFKRRKDGLE